MSTTGIRIKWMESDFENDASDTLRLIGTYLQHFETKIESDMQHGWWSLRLPSPHGAEYRFTLHGELGGERQISAVPFAETGVRPRRFWYSPMEMADFHNDFSKLETVFHERVAGLLRYPTRIFEKKGVIWLSYWAEYQSDFGWRRLGGITNLGLGLGIPFVGKKHIYASPPVRSWAQE